MELYFAYGSNLDQQQMKQRCIEARFLSIGYLPRHCLGFTQFYESWGGGVADVTECPNGRVWGVIYELPMEALEQLDKYEGHPTDYKRSLQYIITREEHRYRAWVYSVERKDGDFIPPSKKYIGIIKQAARDYAFPTDYLSYLDTIKTVNSYSAATISEIK